MGLQSTTGSTVYLSIQGGKIARRVTEATQFSKERQLESGKLIHEELYDSLEGFMTSLTTRDGQFGKELHIHIGDDLKYVVQLKLSSSPASSFLKALPNVDLSKRVKLIPKSEEVKEGVKRTNIILVQENAGIKHAFTKDNPNGLPPMKKVKVKGKETWDDSDQLEFFERLIADTHAKLQATGTLTIGAEADDDTPF
jgi:hypothetical protein